jgi:hypothetical protein
MLRWSSVAPLETPVVPPVYCRKATSPGESFGLLRAPGRDRVVERHRARQRPGRDHLLDAADDEIDDHALEAEQIAHAGDDDVLDRRLRDHLLDGVRKILQHDDGFGAGILELMFEFARRVERVDVDHRETCAQHRGGGDRILQHVRHHDRDARAALEAASLQVGAERQRHLVEVAVADRLVHADERLAVGELLEALLQQVDQRCVLRRLDISGHAGRILLEPDALHGNSPLSQEPVVSRACLIAGSIEPAGIAGKRSRLRAKAAESLLESSQTALPQVRSAVGA